MSGRPTAKKTREVAMPEGVVTIGHSGVTFRLASNGNTFVVTAMELPSNISKMTRPEIDKIALKVLKLAGYKNAELQPINWKSRFTQT